jgi:predicted nucleic acid-binding protein
MKLVVHDASILIDLALSETVDAWFASGIETWTTDLIFPHEIDRLDQRAVLAGYVQAGKLLIRVVTPEEIAVLSQVRSGLTIPDRSAIMLVKELGAGASLATGDKAMRTTAAREKIAACGLLGLFDLMIASQGGRPAALPVEVAIAKLERLLALPGCWLPPERCQEKIRAWRQLL